MWTSNGIDCYFGDCAQGDRVATDVEIADWENSRAPDYKRLRAAEYPPMSDYLDGIVKGNVAQQQAYIAACVAIKDKYPKP